MAIEKMSEINNTRDLEEDEELAALRLAALLSRKSNVVKKQVTPETEKFSIPIASVIPSSNNSNNHLPTNNIPVNHVPYVNYNYMPPTMQNKPHAWRRPRWYSGPPHKNNQRSNLIIISPMPMEEQQPPIKTKKCSTLLVRPQDKWFHTTNEDSSSPSRKTGPTRFNRHDSDSDSSDAEACDDDNDNSCSRTTLLLNDQNICSDKELLTESDASLADDNNAEQESEPSKTVNSLEEGLTNNKPVVETFDVGVHSSDASSESENNFKHSSFNSGNNAEHEPEISKSVNSLEEGFTDNKPVVKTFDDVSVHSSDASSESEMDFKHSSLNSGNNAAHECEISMFVNSLEESFTDNKQVVESFDDGVLSSDATSESQTNFKHSSLNSGNDTEHQSELSKSVKSLEEDLTDNKPVVETFDDSVVSFDASSESETDYKHSSTSSGKHDEHQKCATPSPAKPFVTVTTTETTEGPENFTDTLMHENKTGRQMHHNQGQINKITYKEEIKTYPSPSKAETKLDKSESSSSYKDPNISEQKLSSRVARSTKLKCEEAKKQKLSQQDLRFALRRKLDDRKQTEVETNKERHYALSCNSSSSDSISDSSSDSDESPDFARKSVSSIVKAVCSIKEHVNGPSQEVTSVDGGKKRNLNQNKVEQRGSSSDDSTRLRHSEINKKYAPRIKVHLSDVNRVCDVNADSGDKKRVPVHMRLGKRKRVIHMTQSIAFSDSDNDSGVNSKCQKQNMQIVAQVYQGETSSSGGRKQRRKGKGKPRKKSTR